MMIETIVAYHALCDDCETRLVPRADMDQVLQEAFAAGWQFVRLGGDAPDGVTLLCPDCQPNHDIAELY